MFVRLSANRVIVLFCLYALVLFNVGFWQQAYDSAGPQGSNDWRLLATLPLFLFAALNVLMQILFWPYVQRVLLPFFLLAGSGVAYAVMVQGIYFDADMLRNVFETDRAEVSGWLSWKFAVWLVTTGVLPALWYVLCVYVKTPRRWYIGLARRLASVALSLAVIAGIAAFAYPNYASFFRNNHKIAHRIVPLNIVASSVKNVQRAYTSRRPFVEIGTDAQYLAAPHARKRLLVLVVGETARAQNWGLNPGRPDTTPQLAAMPDVINFPQVSSCGTSTAHSVPCLFSRMDRANYSSAQAKSEDNLLDILQRAGLSIHWRNNNAGCKGVCARVPTVHTRDMALPGECNTEGCLDMALLHNLADDIRALPGDGVIVLHTMGSHGPSYYQRYPDAFRRFAPTCETSQIQDCDRSTLENTYNNTIVYTDHFLAETIRLLQGMDEVDSALWYFSDHGESLGENGLYLHAAPYAVAPSGQTHIPMIFWAKAGFYDVQGLSFACLREKSAAPYSHDNVFHSVLGLLQVQTAEYRMDHDMFASCRK